VHAITLGFDTYSLRALEWKAPQLLDYAASLKLDTIQFSSLSDFESLEPPYLSLIKDQAARLGIAIEAGTRCICPSSNAFSPEGPTIRDGLRVAAALGSKSMRCYMGNIRDRLAIERLMEDTIAVLRSVRAEAMDLGVKIALENHGDLQARELRSVIEEAGPDFVGACLDTGNPVWVVEDPYLSLEILAPYVVTTHVRDSVVWATPRGAAFQWVNLGDGCLDPQRFVAELRRLCPGVAVQLETISWWETTPLPYLEADFWKTFPKMPAWEFARFLRLVRQGGAFPTTPDQQRADLELSLKRVR
jgi:sugar phosphate isomerase/epimerase